MQEIFNNRTVSVGKQNRYRGPLRGCRGVVISVEFDHDELENWMVSGEVFNALRENGWHVFQESEEKNVSLPFYACHPRRGALSLFLIEHGSRWQGYQFREMAGCV